jgi:hypothetical protein
VQGINDFLPRAEPGGRDAVGHDDRLAARRSSIRQSGWQPKAIFGAVLLFVVFWISKRGTKS